MSSVGSVSTPSNSLLMQMIQGQKKAGGVGPPQDGRQAFDQRLDAAASNAGLNPSQVSQLHSDIQSAVQAAIKNAPADANKGAVVRDAVNAVLKKYGIDPASLKSQHAGGAGKAHHHHGGGKAGGVDQKNDGDADDANAVPQNPTDAALAVLKGLPTGSLLDAAA